MQNQQRSTEFFVCLFGNNEEINGNSSYSNNTDF